MIDLGHVLAAAGEAAHCLGWGAALLDDLGTDDLTRILWNGPKEEPGDGRSGRERPDVMLAIFGDGRHIIENRLASIAELETEALRLPPQHSEPGYSPLAEDRYGERGHQKAPDQGYLFSIG